MIIYFSGTGNSRYAAELINSEISDKILCLNDAVNTGFQQKFNSDKPFVIVCPTYAWRIPRVVENTIKNSTFAGNKNIYFVLTCGAGAGNAAATQKKYVMKKVLFLKDSNPL